MTYYQSNYPRRQSYYNMVKSGVAKAAAIGVSKAIGNGITAGSKKAYSYAFPSKKPRVPRKAKKAVRPRPSLQKQITSLKKEVKAMDGTLIYRARDTQYIGNSSNGMTHVVTMSNTIPILEIVLGQLRFFDSATPNTLVTASGASATYSRDYLFKSIHTKIEVRNNHQVPNKCTIYVCRPKLDTSIDPVTAFTNGLADIGSPSGSSPLVYLSDSDEFTKLWKIESSVTKRLNPGDYMTHTVSRKDITYSPAFTDSHSMTYQNKFGSYVILVKLEGCLGHSSGNSAQVGTLLSAVDVQYTTKWEVKYDAGVDLKYVYITDASDVLTLPNVSNKPSSAQQQFSV